MTVENKAEEIMRGNWEGNEEKKAEVKEESMRNVEDEKNE
jgi:hypothetical protein